MSSAGNIQPSNYCIECVRPLVLHSLWTVQCCLQLYVNLYC